ncbi:hypothetical protein [Macrococcus armenti]|uniref:hypothetical protein n=1 Tax=Macrococcus armenti TaxID=2875764 RepID=UPI001CD59D45|nr:hypothetical protein [Macrococcus armenti]UBH10623.1 hypothetical protein LAU38_10350 [Macrococcus armenti]
MDRYAEAIISQFKLLINSKVILEENLKKELRCVIRSKSGREIRKVFRGDTWNAVAYEVNGFMNTNEFKEVYVYTKKPIYY